MGWNDWLYSYRTHVYRKTVAQDSAGVRTGESWTKVASSVPCYKEPLTSTQAATIVGRLEGDNMFSMDKWHFGETEDVVAGDMLRNVTLTDDGSQVADFGEFWVVRGQQQAFASLGVLSLGRKVFLASRQQHGPAGTDPLADLLGAWEFEESSGQRLDSSGRGNHLTAVGSIGSSTTVKKLGTRSASFDGAQALGIDHNDDFAQQAGRSWSLLLWNYLTDKSQVRILASKWDGPSLDAGWTVEYDNISDRYRLQTSPDGEAIDSVSATAMGSPPVNAWTLVAAGYDADAGAIWIRTGTEATLYARSTQSGVTGIFDNPAVPFRIGSNADASPTFYQGYIDGASLRGRSLLDAEIVERWVAGAGVAYPYI
jgi:hypothetical protein